MLENYLQEYKNAKKSSITIEDVKSVAEKLNRYLQEQLANSPKDTTLFLNWVATNKVSHTDISDQDSIQLLIQFLDEHKENLTAQQQARVLTTLAWYHLNSGQFKEELDLLEQAVALGSMYPETYYALGHHYFREETFDLAEKHFEKALFYKQFSFGEVADTSKKALTISFYQYSYAVTLCYTEKFEKARELFQKVIASYPDQPSLPVTTAYCDYKLGDKTKLEQFLKTYISKLKSLMTSEEELYSRSFLRLGMMIKTPIYLADDKPFVFLTTSKIALLFNELADLDAVIDLSEDEDFIVGPDIMFYHYLAALWQTNQIDKFEHYIEQELTELHNILDIEREEAEEMGEDYVEDELIVEMIEKIKENSIQFKAGNKPTAVFHLDNEYVCYSLDQIL